MKHANPFPERARATQNMTTYFWQTWAGQFERASVNHEYQKNRIF